LEKKIKGTGSTEAGLEVVSSFLGSAGIDARGMFMEDGSGLSPQNAVSAKEMTKLLVFMKNKADHFDVFFNSLPEAGKEGTLKGYFTDPLLGSRLSAKSGSMNRVRSYAGYLDTVNGTTIAFTIIVNNYTGQSRPLIASIAEILKELALYKQ
jgi:D-alanyl-D-alanine carboxypeptidase/D-alanyl-D-alanine-endopeptidase (penicillin-binding protein 4)